MGVISSLQNWLQDDRNEYVSYLDVIYLTKDAQIWKNNLKTILDKTQFVEKRDVESTESIQLPWIAICGKGCDIISSKLPKLPESEGKKLSGLVLVERGVETEDANIKSAFQKSYFGCEIEFMTSVDFHTDFEKIRSNIMDLISRGKSIECVFHHIDRTQVHIIVDENGISDTLDINIQARKGILKFLQENVSDEIDVIQELEDELVLVYLESFLHEIKNVNFKFHKTKITPKRPWIFLCDTFDESKYPKQMEMSMDCKSMVLRVCSTSQNLEARDDNATTIHLILRNSEIDDSLCIHDCAKDELRRIEESITSGNVADNYEKTVEVKSKDVSSKHQTRVYIKCMANLERRAFSNFTKRFITRIEPIWMTGDECAEKGSLCIVVCFNLSRLQDEIAAVLTDASQDCKNMLVVIQNCREGMSPKPMLRSNPSDKVIDFTNILYDDGECYDCDINSEASEKVQAFIDNN